jgi:hypothetical protein
MLPSERSPRVEKALALVDDRRNLCELAIEHCDPCVDRGQGG